MGRGISKMAKPELLATIVNGALAGAVLGARYGDSTALDQPRRAARTTVGSGGTAGQAVKQTSTTRRILHAQEKSVLPGREQSRGSPVDTTRVWAREGQVVATRRFGRSR